MASSVTFTTAKSQPPGKGPQHHASSSTPTSPVPRKPNYTSPTPLDPPITPPGTSRFAHAQAAAAAAAASGSVPAPASFRPLTAPNQPSQQQQNASCGEGAKAGAGAPGNCVSAPAAAVAGSTPPQGATTLVNSNTGQNSSSWQGTPAADTSPALLRGNPGTNGSARFHRLARSVDSLQSLRVNNRGGLNAANLQALSEPHWAPSFNSTSPLIPQGPLLDPQPLNATQQHQQQAGQGYPGQQGAGEVGEEQEEARKGCPEGGGEWGPDGSCIPNSEAGDGVGHAPQQQQQYQPRMAASMPLHVQDIQDGAVASLLASKQAAANGEVHTAQRPFTARMPANIGPRVRMGHPMANFKPSRGQALQVFQNLDKDKNGKVTLAELEDTGLSLGFSLEQIHRLFKRMDKGNKGYLKPSDWGDQEFVKVLEFFSLMYMQKYMGLPTQASTPEQVGKYFGAQELRQIKTVPAAISMARTNAVMRAINAANYNEFILDCFKFVDPEQKGSLNVDGLRDGFAALGVQVTDEVAKQIIGKYGADTNGYFNYQECVPRLFGKSSAF
ncbi:hypothetical protein DUNSADRAFT_15586 [Dunaliella salina]|uniref:EF-hand domain-containing protein n=1 Tax=Dunaliella salina TaxID=3046 RepID=A0ABQ7G543_DUNSA|nr:hypothetical protein DUNSADRAFT_15586 [Dunaliella salina]|eukprot:KAF5829721.1 hypothetical protein DUNSADRAFT_15586 [Dunaliella salina]